MNYHDVYFSRINYMGETMADKIRNGGIRSFERWMAESPFTIEDLSVERGLYFSGIIQTNKDKEERKTMYLYVANDIPIVVGDILNWKQDDGTIDKWLLLKKEQKVNGTYQTFWIIKCNYLIRWIDSTGRLKKSWAYAVSSVDDKIKGNFRTWHNLITPQPNKYAEIIMPRQEIDRGTNFILEDEGWKLVESDFTSVAGIIYMSLTEGKVNYQYDDLNVDVADTDKLKFPELGSMYTVGEEIVPDFGEFTFNEWEIELIPTINENVVAFTDDKLYAVGEGTATIIMQLKDRKAVQKRFEIIVRAAQEEFSAFINGPDSIKLDRYGNYILEGTTPINGEVTYRLGDQNKDYATIQMSTEDANVCIIHANKKNKIGEIILIATYDGVDYSKTIKIIPLW